MMGETRQAVSFRIKRIYTHYLKKKGFRGHKAACQKDEEAVEEYRKSAKGNRHRANSVAKKRARQKSRQGPSQILNAENAENTKKEI